VAGLIPTSGGRDKERQTLGVKIPHGDDILRKTEQRAIDLRKSKRMELRSKAR
jgi:hypothetical protein